MSVFVKRCVFFKLVFLSYQNILNWNFKFPQAMMAWTWIQSYNSFNETCPYKCRQQQYDDFKVHAVRTLCKMLTHVKNVRITIEGRTFRTGLTLGWPSPIRITRAMYLWWVAYLFSFLTSNVILARYYNTPFHKYFWWKLFEIHDSIMFFSSEIVTCITRRETPDL